MAADSRRLARRRDQRGETLIETILSMSLVAVVFTVALGALYTTVNVSDHQRKSARSDSVLRSAAEKLQSPDTAYVARAGCSGAGSYTVPAPSVTEAGYTLSIASVTYWGGASSTPTATATATFSTTCPTTSAADGGLQVVTLKMVDPNGAVTTLPVVKRRP